MILKIIGSLLVMTATSAIGFALARDCSRRPRQLRELQGILQMFENEISFLSNILTDAFLKIYASASSEVAEFFKATIDNLKAYEGINASEAWEKAVNDNIKRTALNKEDESILVSFGKMLGNSDLEGQIKNIRLTLTQLKLQEQKAEESRKKNESMYKNLGILSGLAVVIILL